MSKQEHVDVVDENDNVSGITKTIEQAHDDIEPHRVSAVLVFKPSGKLLVQVHKYHGQRLDHSVGGHVSAGETYLDAAKREMQEELELGIALKEIATGIVSREHYPKTGEENLHIFGVYTAEVPEDWTLTETEEVNKILEMPIEDIVEDMNTKPDTFLQGFMTSLSVYLKNTNSHLKISAYGRVWGEL